MSTLQEHIARETRLENRRYAAISSFLAGIDPLLTPNNTLSTTIRPHTIIVTTRGTAGSTVGTRREYRFAAPTGANEPAAHEVDDSQLLHGPATIAVAQEVINERVAQDTRFGEQNHPDGTGTPQDKAVAAWARRSCDAATQEGRLTWRHILQEEFYEASAESDPARLREELIQVAAVASAWAEAIDRRTATATTNREVPA